MYIPVTIKFALVFLHFLDVDECAQNTHNCSADAVCNNTNGAYNCTCKPRYHGDGLVCAGEILRTPSYYLTLGSYLHFIAGRYTMLDQPK